MDVNQRLDTSRHSTRTVSSALVMLLLAGCAGMPSTSVTAASPQTETEQALHVERGIVFNELGDLDAALREFRAVLAANPNNVDALYEAALTLYAMRDYDACARLAERGARLASARTAGFELLLGNALDEAGNTRAAIAAYRRSIAIDDSNYLAHFNLSVTLARNNETAASRASAQAGLRLHPEHASGHLLLARLYHYDGFRVPAILAYARFLLLEANTRRSAEAAEALHTLLAAGATVTNAPSAVTLSLMQSNPDLSEGDFQPLDLALSLLQGLQASSTSGAVAEASQIADRFELLFGMLSSQQPVNGAAGFAWEFYAPYFAAVETLDFTELVTYLTLRAQAIPEVDTWLDDNHGKVDRFLAWSAGWRWQ